MSQLVAIDVAVLLPQEVSGRAIELSAMLAAGDPQALRLGAGCLPHITLAQQFVGAVSLDACLDAVGVVLQGVAPLQMSVTGVGRGNTTVWMSVERSPALLDLHRRLMDALETFEQTDGAADAFLGNARPKDIEWVRSYRRASSGMAFTPHITLGHSTQTTPLVEPLTFEAAMIAACQLGRFCSCGRVLRRWTL